MTKEYRGLLGRQWGTNLLLVLFLQSDNVWYKVSGKCQRFKIITQLALQTHQNFQCYLHKAEEVFVSIGLCEKNVHYLTCQCYS